MENLLRILFLEDSSTRTIVLGTAALGLASGVIGAFAVLRQRALVSDAIAHASLPGVCTAFLLVGDRDLTLFLIAALIFGLLSAGFITATKSLTRIKEDAAIGISIGLFFGLGLVLSRIIQNQPLGNQAGIDSFIFGRAASMVRQDAYLIVLAACVVLVLVTLLFKEFCILCFDKNFGQAQGLPITILDFTLMGLVTICTIVGLPAVGALLVVSLLIIPGMAARFWTDSVRIMVILAGTIGLISASGGTLLSAVLPAPAGSLSRGWPTGPLITLVAAFLFSVSFLLAPKRGLLWDLYRRRYRMTKVLADKPDMTASQA